MTDSDSENGQGNNGQGNNDVSGNAPVSDISGVSYDISGVTYSSPQIVSDLSSTIITGTGYEIEHAEGKDEDGDDLKKTTFDTTEPELYDPQIHQYLKRLQKIKWRSIMN